MIEKQSVAILFKEIKNNLQNSSFAKEYLKSIGWSDEEINTAPVGYISSLDKFKDSLEKKCGDNKTLKSWGMYNSLMDYRLVVGWQQPDNTIKLNGFAFGNKNTEDKTIIFQSGFKKDKPFLYAQSKNKKDNQIYIVSSALDGARLQANSINTIALGSLSITREQVEYLTDENKEYTYIIADSSKSRISAEKLILGLSKFNISVKVLQIKNTEATEISLFSGMTSKEIANYMDINISVSSGEYMASRVNSQHKSGTHKSNESQKIKNWRREMSKTEVKNFDKQLNKDNIYADIDTAEILRVMASLLDLNMDYDKAKAIVKRRFNVYINIKDFNKER